MFDKVAYAAKAWVAGLATAVATAVAQVAEFSDINSLGADGYFKALGAGALAAVAVYFAKNK